MRRISLEYVRQAEAMSWNTVPIGAGTAENPVQDSLRVTGIYIKLPLMSRKSCAFIRCAARYLPLHITKDYWWLRADLVVFCPLHLNLFMKIPLGRNHDYR